MTDSKSLRSDWITDSTECIVHLDSVILYKERPTLSVPIVSLERGDEGILVQTPVDVGDDNAPVNSEGGGRHYPYSEINYIEYMDTNE